MSFKNLQHFRNPFIIYLPSEKMTKMDVVSTSFHTGIKLPLVRSGDKPNKRI